MAKEDEIDLYKVFGVASDATAATIKKAYHRLCLQYHPDKLSILSTDEERQQAAVTFQRLTHYHTILADPDRRLRYDQTGFVGKVGGSDEENGVAFEAPEQGWTAFFKELWGGLITEDTINAFALKYRGSNDENEDVIKAYKMYEGSMDKVLESIPLCSYEDESRFRQIVQDGVDDGSITEVYERYFTEDKRATDRRRKGAEKEEKAFLKAEATRKKKEAAAAKKGGKSTNTKKDDDGEDDGMDELAAELQRRAKERMGGLIEKLEAKATASSSGKRGSKRGTPAKSSEPSEEEFRAIQNKLFQKDARTASSSKKGKNAAVVEAEDDWSDDDVDELEEVQQPAKSKRARRVYLSHRMELSGRATPQHCVQQTYKNLVFPQRTTKKKNSELIVNMIAGATHFEELFGSTLVNKKGEQIATKDALAGKNVAIYFSAHWCPPCRGFTPDLSKYYNNMKDNNTAPFELVFVSADNSQNEFEEYFNEMASWLALPYSDRETNTKLSEKFNPEGGIPCLVFLDSHGALISSQGRSLVAKDPLGKHFPYAQKPLLQILNETRVEGRDETLSELVKGKHTILHFHAGDFSSFKWRGVRCDGCDASSFGGNRFRCNDCQDYDLCSDCHSKVASNTMEHDHSHTFKLVENPLVKNSAQVLAVVKESYSRIGQEDLPVEVVTVATTAETRDAFDVQTSGVSWHRTAFDESGTAVFAFTTTFDDIEPTYSQIVVIDDNGVVVNADAIYALKKNAPFPFLPLKLSDLSESQVANGYRLFQKPTGILYCASAPPQQFSELETVLLAVIDRLEKHQQSTKIKKNIVCTDDMCVIVGDDKEEDSNKAPEPQIIFFTCKDKESHFYERFRSLAGLGEEETKPELALFDPITQRTAKTDFEIREVDKVVEFVNEFLSACATDMEDE
ncbi:UNVERIFIED_CONTAM: hypothetical protein HDU68_010700 [Siphonaria sp. JEL0065]|nr:hypothetical protein HDU68_010700 [Siphonaria sp. JEL0065]